MSFPTQTSKPDFAIIFDTVDRYRSENHIFQTSIDTRSDDNQFRFYDGPPFVTGLPHYGHLASSVAKDVIPRYQTMLGKKVDRVRGRDCHGIPIEQKVQKKLGLESNLDIEKVGIEKFINECYDYTRSTSSEWKRYIDQFARWVDFDNSYKTMDNDYMESVRRVFKTLRDKGLIYKGKRVSLYSTKLETPISNFEVAMDDTYEEVNDPAITVMFDLSVNGDQYAKTYILAWTTTPWTIPLNIALAVNKDVSYVIVECGEHKYIVAQQRVETFFLGKDYAIVGEVLGSNLVGLAYQPPFDYLYNKTGTTNDHKIYHADFITDTDGTGIAHEAPEFGEVDFQLAKQVGLTITEGMDSSGHYTSLLEDKAGIFYREANPIVVQELHDMGRLFKKESITHRVAFCPRSGTPLVYKAQDSRFIDINGPQDIFGGKSLKQKCIEANEDINRYPAHNKYGRFLKSLESAPDRCISRTRYRGTPMPIYKATTFSSSGAKGNGVERSQEFVIIGSREELFELSKTGSKNIEKREKNGKTLYRNTTRDAELDLHRPYIDDVWFEKDGVRYERISEVLDCRVESASMPYAQVHYPFENKEKFEKSFPADYIVEYTGQIRAWFYVMHVLGVALFDKPAFKNVICHGVVAGNDGRKMSKSLGNFPDPKPTFAQYGGDAVRMSILTTSLFNGGDMSFSEDLIKEALKQNVLPLWNAFYFFTTYANIDGWNNTSLNSQSSDNLLDQRILAELANFIGMIQSNLDVYDLTNSSRQISLFLENLTNRYIRRSRRRFRKSENDGDKNHAYQTLYTVLVEFCKAAAPFMPIITEYIYRSLTRSTTSVHLQDFPQQLIQGISMQSDMLLQNKFSQAQTIVRAGLAARSKRSIRVRQPLASLKIGIALDSYFSDLIADELNIKSVIFDPTLNERVTKICKPDGKIIGAKFGGHTKQIFELAKSGVFVESSDGSVVVGERLLEPGSFEISYIKKDESDSVEVEEGIAMEIDWNLTDELVLEGYARDVVRSIQDGRKEADYDIADRIYLQIIGGKFAEDLINHHGMYIQEETLSTISYTISEYDLTKSLELGGQTLTFMLKKNS